MLTFPCIGMTWTFAGGFTVPVVECWWRRTLSFITGRRRRMAVARPATAMPVRTARTEKPLFGCCLPTLRRSECSLLPYAC